MLCTLPCDIQCLAQKTIVRCLFHMVAERGSEGTLDAMPSSERLVPESSLASEEEQELTEIDMLEKQFEKSKAEQEKVNAIIQDLIKMMEVFQEKENTKAKQCMKRINVVRKAACQSLRDSTRKT